MLAGIKGAAGCRSRVLQAANAIHGRCFSLSAVSTSIQEEEQYLAAVAERFQEAPETAAKSLADSLSSQHRAILLEALGSEAQRVPKEYADKLFKEADTTAPLQQLDKYEMIIRLLEYLATAFRNHSEHISLCTREEFVKALKLDRQLTATANAGSTDAPTLGMCTSVALAAGLPFVGFGFLDNFIMV